jgi:hypothetical protein
MGKINQDAWRQVVISTTSGAQRMRTEAIEPDKPTLVFRLGQIIFLPHYFMKNKYVSPGYHETYNPVRYSSDQLKALGAQPMMMKLWERHWS